MSRILHFILALAVVALLALLVSRDRKTFASVLSYSC
ncbi:permease [Mixta gaviniae]|nr:permease [Mixta gaviniae]